MPTGTIGAPVAAASRAVPVLPTMGSRSSEIVPSGKTATHSPARERVLGGLERSGRARGAAPHRDLMRAPEDPTQARLGEQLLLGEESHPAPALQSEVGQRERVEVRRVVRRQDHRSRHGQVREAFDLPPHAEVHRWVQERLDTIEDRLHGPVAYAAPWSPSPVTYADAGVVIPLRAFRSGKARLADVLDEDQRASLALTMAEHVVAAAGPLSIVVVSSDAEVRAWAEATQLDVVSDPGHGLDAAASAGVDHHRTRGRHRAVVAHADLPHAPPSGLVRFAALTGGIVGLVPCHRDDGTPVLSVPTEPAFPFEYGPGSARRHAAVARRLGLATLVVRDPELGYDVDVPADLDALDRATGAVTDGAGAGTVLTPPARALAIGAHPDDVEFGAGGTLARWAAAGTEVHLLVLTDGSKGTWDADDDLVRLIATRVDEARDAAKTLADGTVHFGGFVDGELESGIDARRVVCRTIREVRPDVVLGHDPWQRYRLHPDHRHAGWATVDGIVAARDPHFFPGLGGPHHRPDALLLFEADEPDHIEPIDATIAVKVDALLRHRSQWRSTMAVDPDASDLDAAIARFGARVTDDARTDDGRLVERFRLITDL